MNPLYVLLFSLLLLTGCNYRYKVCFIGAYTGDEYCDAATYTKQKAVSVVRHELWEDRRFHINTRRFIRWVR